MFLGANGLQPPAVTEAVTGNWLQYGRHYDKGVRPSPNKHPVPPQFD
jgi:hypothetical protein